MNRGSRNLQPVRWSITANAPMLKSLQRVCSLEVHEVLLLSVPQYTLLMVENFVCTEKTGRYKIIPKDDWFQSARRHYFRRRWLLESCRTTQYFKAPDMAWHSCSSSSLRTLSEEYTLRGSPRRKMGRERKIDAINVQEIFIYPSILDCNEHGSGSWLTNKSW